MINLSHLDGTGFVLNADLIELIEAKPDTVITTTSGKHFIVKESLADVVSRIIDYQRTVRQSPENRVLRAGEPVEGGRQVDG